MEYEIKFHPLALQEFCELDGSIKKLVKKQLDKLKTSPLLGKELGNKNGYDLSGYRKMYACKKQIRKDLGFDQIPVTLEMKASRKKWEDRER